jgi:hypothetical protein
MKTVQAVAARDKRAVPDAGRKLAMEPAVAAAQPSHGAEAARTGSSGHRLADMPIGRLAHDGAPPGEPDRNHAEAIPNHTGLPDGLKAGLESLSGLAMDDVRVHFNSPRPATLQAHAYTQGSEIHVGPGQEQHLPHEAWHVAQQKQGRVKPTLRMKGKPINDDDALEREADVMGGAATDFVAAAPWSYRHARVKRLRPAGVRALAGEPQSETPLVTMFSATSERSMAVVQRSKRNTRRKKAIAKKIRKEKLLQSKPYRQSKPGRGNDVQPENLEMKEEEMKEDQGGNVENEGDRDEEMEEKQIDYTPLMNDFQQTFPIETRYLNDAQGYFVDLMKQYPMLQAEEKQKADDVFMTASENINQLPNVTKPIRHEIKTIADDASKIRSAKENIEKSMTAFENYHHGSTIAEIYARALGGRTKRDQNELATDIDNIAGKAMAKYRETREPQHAESYAVIEEETMSAFRNNVYDLLIKEVGPLPDARETLSKEIGELSARAPPELHELYGDLSASLRSEPRAARAEVADPELKLNDKDYATGEDSANAIPLLFYKQKADYPKIKPKLQFSKLPALDPGRATTLHLPEEKVTIGGQNFDRIKVDAKIQDNAGHSLPRARSTRLRTLLKAYYNYPENHDMDHILDLGFGGKDEDQNLWPLPNAINRRPINGWRTRYQMHFSATHPATNAPTNASTTPTRGVNKRQVMLGAIGSPELFHKWFKIKGHMAASGKNVPDETGKKEAGRKT